MLLKCVQTSTITEFSLSDMMYKPHGNHKQKTCKREVKKIKRKEYKQNEENDQITNKEKQTMIGLKEELQKQETMKWPQIETYQQLL